MATRGGKMLLSRPQSNRMSRRRLTSRPPKSCDEISKRRARDSNPQPLAGHHISSVAASHSLTLRAAERFYSSRSRRPAQRARHASWSWLRWAQILVESKSIAERIDRLHRLGVPRGNLNAGAEILVLLRRQFGVELVDASNTHEGR